MEFDDAILNATMVYSEEEVLGEFQECFESEAETRGHHTERFKAVALTYFLDRSPPVKKFPEP